MTLPCGVGIELAMAGKVKKLRASQRVQNLLSSRIASKDSNLRVDRLRHRVALTTSKRKIAIWIRDHHKRS